MDTQTILTIVSAILGVFALVAGGLWAKGKGKLNAVKNLMKESYDLVNVAVSAIDDDKITKEEVDQIKQEASEVKVAWRVLIGKDL